MLIKSMCAPSLGPWPGCSRAKRRRRRLGVKLPTLYAYVSRGLLVSHPSDGGRRRLFDVDDVEHLARRSRGGRRVESRLASVTTGITQIREDGAYYRGHRVTALALTATFEEVADLLWRARPAPEHWVPSRLPRPPHLDTADLLRWVTVLCGAKDRLRADLRPELVIRSARRLITTMVHGLPGQTEPASPAGGSTAAGLARRLVSSTMPGASGDELARTVDMALVLLADHELATSTVAVRVAASTRADLYDAILAGLGTAAGPLHGGASQLAYRLIVDAERRRRRARRQRVPSMAADASRVRARRLPPRRSPGDPASRVLPWPGPPRTTRPRWIADRVGPRPRRPSCQRGPRTGGGDLGDGDAGRRRRHDLHHRPGRRLDGPLPRGTGRKASPVPSTRRLRHREREPPIASGAVPRYAWRFAAGLLTLTLVGLVTSSCSSPTSRAVAGPTPVGFVHVADDHGSRGAAATPYLVDGAGRRVLMHGVAVVGLEDVAYPGAAGGPALFPVNPAAYDGRCPAASARIPQPPLCEVQAAKPAYDQSTAAGSGDDLAEMRALGFDMVRLVLNWSQIEPDRRALLRCLPRPGGPGRRVGTAARDLGHPRHAPGSVLALHPPRSHDHGGRSSVPILRWFRRRPEMGRVHRRQAGVRHRRADGAEPGVERRVRRLLGQPHRGRAGRASLPAWACRTITSVPWPRWPSGSGMIRP